MKKKLVIILAFLGVFVIAGIIVIPRLTSTDRFDNLGIDNVDLATIPDGIYSGSAKVFPINVELTVNVSDHKITAITLDKHFNGQGADAEVIPNRVIEAQSLEVDLVSGATYSSKVILKAIENALNSVAK